MEPNVPLLQSLLCAIKCFPFFNECCAEILVNPYSGTLVLQLVIPGPAQCRLLLLKPGETYKGSAGGSPLARPGFCHQSVTAGLSPIRATQVRHWGYLHQDCGHELHRVFTIFTAFGDIQNMEIGREQFSR